MNLTSDPTSIQDADHTPTEIKETEPPKMHKTSSGTCRFLAGTVLGKRYRILTLLGQGGMGEVYKAEDLELEQTVALKFLPEELSNEQDFLRRFKGEVRTARQVSHPNVCRVFDLGEVEGLYFISMEFIEGDDLSMLLNRIGRLPSDKAVEISRQISLGLGAIHKAGILHRDLKPSNIIIDQKGEARITDFGIAGIEAEVQGEEARVGTPAYMSPEQITGKEVTKRSDIYSLGLLLYEIFTGKQAFEGSSVQELREKHTKDNPTNPSELVTGIDPVVEDLIERCLKKDPQERPDSALKVAMMLPGGNPLEVALEAGETPTPEMVAAAPKKGALSRLTGLGLLVVFCLSVLFTAYWRSIHDVTALVPLDDSPEVLAKRAEEVARNFGYTKNPVDVNYIVLLDYEVYAFASKQENPKEWWNRLSKGQPALLYFRYRQSPGLLIPGNENGSVSDYDPPLLAPGMIRMTLDTTGRLLSFAAVPENDASEAGSGNVDWKAVFDEAGLDISRFTESDRKTRFTFEHDEAAAWEGHLAENPDIPVSVVGSALNGRPVEFKIIPPWDAGESALGTIGKDPYPPFGIILVTFVLTVLISAGLLARYNLQKGRGNLGGALKFGVFCSAAYLIADLLRLELTGSFGENTRRVGELIYESPFFGVAAFVLYLGIEPIMRKRFSTVFISWNRLLMGNVKDPLIGRDVLIGLTSGALLTILLEIPRFFSIASSDSIYVPVSNYLGTFLLSFLGYGDVLGSLIRYLITGLIVAFFYLFFLFLSSLVAKQKWQLVLVAAVTISLFRVPDLVGAGLWEEIVVLLVYNLVAVTCLVRFGYVAAVAFLFAGDLIVPGYVFDSESFLFPVTIFVILLFTLIGLISFLIATSGQPWIKGKLREELGG